MGRKATPVKPKSVERLNQVIEVIKGYKNEETGRKISQNDIAKMCNTQAPTMSGYVHGNTALPVDVAEGLTKIYKSCTGETISVDWLLGISDYKTSLQAVGARIEQDENLIGTLFRDAAKNLGYEIIKGTEEYDVEISDVYRYNAHDYAFVKDGKVMATITPEKMDGMVEQLHDYAEYQVYAYLRKVIGLQKEIKTLRQENDEASHEIASQFEAILDDYMGV